MQFQSDILNLKISRPRINESTALGAAFMSGLATNFYKNIADLEKVILLDKIFTPKMANKERMKLYENWIKAVTATRTFK